MLFGDQQYAHLADELPQYAVDIIVQNPRAIAEWDQITRTMQGAALHRNKNTFREVMKRFGFPLAAIGSLFQASQHITVTRPIKKPGQLRGGTSPFNLR